MKRVSTFVLVFVFCSIAHSAGSTANRQAIRLVTVSGMQFLSPSGKPVQFRGVNVTNKSKDQGYTDNITPADFKQIRSWGMNVIRLCIFWDGLEPEPNQFDKQYLERIATLVGDAKQQGLYVLLDMHQDLYSIKFSDGAPLWATIDENLPHTKGAQWSDSYYFSQAVQASLDHFWANSAAPDGVGLQNHYARVWQMVAQRFNNEPAVIGYDLMNEPFPGADAAVADQASLTRLSEMLNKQSPQKVPTPVELSAMEATAKGRGQIIQWMADMNLFRSMVDAATPVMQHFERTQLNPMYALVAKAIRQVDKRHIIFLEPSMSANMGVPSALVPLVNKDGRRDPQQAYAPHVYDVVVDTDFLNLTSTERIDLIIDRHRQFSRLNHMPMLVGEWGAFYLNAQSYGPTKYIVDQFDAVGSGNTFWAYARDMKDWVGLAALKRPVSK